MVYHATVAAVVVSDEHPSLLAAGGYEVASVAGSAVAAAARDAALKAVAAASVAGVVVFVEIVGFAQVVAESATVVAVATLDSSRGKMRVRREVGRVRWVRRRA